MRRAVLGASVLVALAPLVACGATADGGGALDAAFGASARANGVPRDLLVAIAVTEGGLEVPKVRDVDPDAAVAAAGPLQLRRGRFDSLARGAALVGASPLDLRRDADLALEAGARVVAELGTRHAARGGDLGSWEAALEELSGYADAAHRRDYAHRVFAALAAGGTFAARDGEAIHLAPHALPPSLTIDLAESLRIQSAGAEYPGAEWFPTDCTSKCNATRSGAAVEMLVIHDTEGGWDASVATLQNDPGKSVHYIVGQDGRIGQFVTESVLAWHAGNSSYNARSIGIEHVGYATKPYPEAEYAASARLVRHLAGKYGVPVDRAHVVGHDQVPNGDRIAKASPACSDSPKACEASDDYGGSGNHRDPGVWEWATYMPRIGGAAKCDDVTALRNCSNDHRQAFRCVGGVVEVDACGGGCVTRPGGEDDVCSSGAPPIDDAPVTVPPIVRLPPSDAGDESPPNASATLEANAHLDARAGCAVGGAPEDARSRAFAMLASFTLGAALARRRRRS